LNLTKTDFVYCLLRILERDGLSYPCVILFCSNNFDTIFDSVNSIHTISLKKRFLSIDFTRCDKNDLVEYLNYYNKLFKETELYIDENNLNSIIKKIKPDLSITYRDLSQISIKADFDLERIITSVNNYEAEEIIESRDNSEEEIIENPEEDSDLTESNNSEEEKEIVEEKNQTKQKIERELVFDYEIKEKKAINNSVSKIGSLINKFVETREYENKLKILIELYKELSKPDSLIVMASSDKFRKTVFDKMIEFINNHPSIKNSIRKYANIIGEKFPEFCI